MKTWLTAIAIITASVVLGQDLDGFWRNHLGGKFMEIKGDQCALIYFYRDDVDTSAAVQLMRFKVNIAYDETSLKLWWKYGKAKLGLWRQKEVAAFSMELRSEKNLILYPDSENGLNAPAILEMIGDTILEFSKMPYAIGDKVKY